MLAILAVLFSIERLPELVRVVPGWTSYVAAAAMIGPMIGVTLAPASVLWPRIERTVVLLFVVIAMPGLVAVLSALIRVMVLRPALSGFHLLTSSVQIWVMNVVVFSLAYWQLDRGGPAARTGSVSIVPDWRFPQEAPGGGLPGWGPLYVDYLFLAFCNATAFSPTDTVPMTRRAKVLTMVESTVSLATILLVAARAIGILK
jgi:hypothetical protein